MRYKLKILVALLIITLLPITSAQSADKGALEPGTCQDLNQTISAWFTIDTAWHNFTEWLCPPAYAADKGASPVAHWRFDEAGGPTAYDDSANNNDGTMTPGAGGTNTAAGQMWTRQGKLGGAVEFDGTDDYVQTSAFEKQSNQKTICAWVKPANQAGLKGLVIHEGAFYLRLNGMRLEARVYDNTGTVSETYNSVSALPADQWSFVCEVIDASTAGPINLKFYINGKLDLNQDTNKNGIGISTSGTNYLKMGNDDDAAGRFFDGFIDDVRIYNYARTASQIMVDYNAGASAHLGAGTDSNEGNPPVGYWSFDENTGATLYDRSGNNINGTLGSSSGLGASAPTWYSAGKYGSCLSFNGTNTAVDLGDYDNFSVLQFGAGNWSVFAWVKPDAQTGESCVFGLRTGSDHDFRIGIDANNKAYVTWVDYPTHSAYSTTTSSASLNGAGWHQIGAKREGGTITLYVDGQLAGTDTTVGTYNITGNQWFSRWSIGAFFDGCCTTFAEGDWQRFFKGNIDEVKIYNYARTPAQIAYDYNKGKPVAHYRFDEGGGRIAHSAESKADQGAAPVGWWRMDEGTGGTTADGSGNGNTGTLTPGAAGTNTTTAAMWDQSGKIGPDALEFDGTDDYVETTLNTDTLSSPITISFWFNASNVIKSPLVSGYPSANPSANRWDVQLDRLGNDKIGWIEHQSGAYVESTSTIQPSTWYYVTVVHDLPSSTAKLYLNGILENSEAINQDVNTGRTLLIADGDGTNFAGLIDDVRIYNYARTAEQIYNDYKTTHGTLVGDTKFVDGKIGKALEFDGTGDYVNIADSTTLSVTGAVTVEAWFKRGATQGTYQGLVSKGGNGQYASYALVFHTDNGIYFLQSSDGSTWGTNILSNTKITDNNWHHVVGVSDLTTARLYIDGVEDNTDATPTASLWDNDTHLTIGSETAPPTNTVGRYFNGLIDDVRIYNYARTADQIMQDYSAGSASRLGAQGSGLKDPWGGNLPVAHWRLDENTGVLARDASGNGNDGTLGGDGAGTDVPTWAQGKHGPGLSFDGGNDYVRIPISSSIQGITSAMTISAWVYKKDTNGEMIINNHIQNYGTPISGAIFSVSTGNYPNLQLRLNNTCCQAVTSSTAIQINQWYHLAATWDGSTMKLYTNGILQSPTQSASGTNQMSRDLFIGTNADDFFNSSFTNQFNGYIDDVRIYNYARTQAQIAWDYNRGAPVAYYRMDETSGTTAYDDSDNNNDGTIVIGATGTQTTIAAARTNGATGKYGRCISFDGTDDYTTTPVGSAISTSTDDITITCWVKLNSTTQQMLVDQGSAANVGRDTIRIDGGLLASYHGAVAQLTGTNTISTGSWYFVALTYDVTGTSASRKLYLNGKLEASDSINNPESSTQNFILGKDYAGGWFVDGLIDDVRIYNYTRTAGQIMEDFNAGAAARLGD